MSCLLALVQESDRLSAIVCQSGLRKTEIKAVFRRPFAGDLARTLTGLKGDCEAGGYGGAWTNEIRVCLAAREAIFHDCLLPTASARVAKKTVPLLLESEFPFDPDAFAARTIFFHYGDKKQFGALTTLVPQKTLNAWREALQACGTPAAKIFLAPWPIADGLKKRGKNSLLVCLDGSQGIICALNREGAPMRIQQFSLHGKDESCGLAIQRKCQMLLAGMPFKPEELLLYDPVMSSSDRKSLQENFGLPLVVVGADAPVAGQMCRLEENDSARLTALGMMPRLNLDGRRMPFFALRMETGAASRFPRQYWWGAAGVLALVAGLGFSFLLDALDNRSKAEYLRGQMLAQLKEAMPDAPKNAGLGRLRSILNSRIAELENSGASQTDQIALKMLEQIHAAVPASLDIDVHRFGMDERHARIYGRAGSYEDVNVMKEKLESLDGVSGCRIVNAASRAERGSRPYVEFELDLPRLRKP